MFWWCRAKMTALRQRYSHTYLQCSRYPCFHACHVLIDHRLCPIDKSVNGASGGYHWTIDHWAITVQYPRPVAKFLACHVYACLPPVYSSAYDLKYVLRLSRVQSWRKVRGAMFHRGVILNQMTAVLNAGQILTSPFGISLHL